jgi:hypothetical protein
MDGPSARFDQDGWILLDTAAEGRVREGHLRVKNCAADRAEARKLRRY